MMPNISNGFNRNHVYQPVSSGPRIPTSAQNQSNHPETPAVRTARPRETGSGDTHFRNDLSKIPTKELVALTPALQQTSQDLLLQLQLKLKDASSPSGQGNIPNHHLSVAPKTLESIKGRNQQYVQEFSKLQHIQSSLAKDFKWEESVVNSNGQPSSKIVKGDVGNPVRFIKDVSLVAYPSGLIGGALVASMPISAPATVAATFTVALISTLGGAIHGSKKKSDPSGEPELRCLCDNHQRLQSRIQDDIDILDGKHITAKTPLLHTAKTPLLQYHPGFGYGTISPAS